MNIKLGEQLLSTTLSISINFEKPLLSKNVPARHYYCLQNITFEYADFYAKMSLILDTRDKKSITQRTLICTSLLLHGHILIYRFTSCHYHWRSIWEIR